MNMQVYSLPEVYKYLDLIPCFSLYIHPDFSTEKVQVPPACDFSLVFRLDTSSLHLVDLFKWSSFGRNVSSIALA